MNNNTQKNRKAVISFILALCSIAFYIGSTLVVGTIPFFQGYVIVVLSLFGLGAVASIIGLLLGIGGVRQPKMKALSIIGIILCAIILGMVTYSGIVMLLGLL